MRRALWPDSLAPDYGGAAAGPTLGSRHELSIATQSRAPHPAGTVARSSRIFGQVFLFRQYALNRAAPKAIIDGGAHIGCATVDFAQRYPDARSVAVEPNRENFALLAENTRLYPNVHCLHGAIWPDQERLRIANPKADSWAFQCEPGGDVAGYRISDLLTLLNAERLDILKLNPVKAPNGSVTDARYATVDGIARISFWSNCMTIMSPGCRHALDTLLATARWTERERSETVVVQRVS